MKIAPRHTLTRALLGWVLGALVVVWGSFMVVGYRTGQHEADELTDGHLASVVALLLSQPAAGYTAAPAVGIRAPGELKAHDYQQSMSVIVWDEAGRMISRTGTSPVPAFDATEGFETLQLGDPARPWRVFSRWDEGRQRKVMVMLSAAERDDLAQDIAEQVTEPGMWLLPITALVLGLAIRRGLRPLYLRCRRTSARSTSTTRSRSPRQPATRS